LDSNDHLVAPAARQDHNIDFTLTGGAALLGRIVLWPQNEYCTAGNRDVRTVEIYNRPSGSSDWTLVLTSPELTQSCGPGSNVASAVVIPPSAGASSQWRVRMKTFYAIGNAYAGFVEVQIYACA
jgi:hypothetical protein